MCPTNRFDCSIAVIKTDHPNKYIFSIAVSGVLIFKMIVIKLMTSIIEVDYTQRKLKMASSSEPPEWD